MGNVILGAVIALVAVLIGYAITQRNTPDDGFKLLIEEIKKLQPAEQWNGEVHTCIHCDYQVKIISETSWLEMKHHIETKHADQLGGEKLFVTDTKVLQGGHPNIHP